MVTVAQFLGTCQERVETLSKAAAEAYWKTTTTGEEQYEQEYMKLQQERIELFSNKEDYATLKVLLADPKCQRNGVVLRQLTLLEHEYTPNQQDKALLAAIVEAETEIESEFTRFRAQIDGQAVPDNEILEILQKETNSERRRQAWEASKQIGSQVADRVVELARMRNRIAAEAGYKNYYAMSLALQELNGHELFAILKRLEQLTDEPFRRMKAKLDEQLTRKFGITESELMPWHYADPFFQEAPILENLDLDPYFKEKNIEALACQFFQDIGLNAADILTRSDLYERENKNQHAYCIDIDHAGDIRVLANIRDNEWWMSTMLHEIGHGVYDKYIDRTMPYLLRTPAHTLTTEAIAMFMGRLTKNTDWLIRYTDISAAEAERLQPLIDEQLNMGMLIFIRWGLVMVHFEHEMYHNPDQDLNALWWSLVERFQLIRKPEGRNAPDWAAKIHIGTAPVYYQNYILGELMASQLHYSILDELGHPSYIGERGTGAFLIRRIFHPGASVTWNELLKNALGEGLNPDYFVQQFIE
ncbi:M2 family metallopeptidase [Aneurinibacillus uraniidurans]|uniref:M2 family metallopeptidase n=1 Tax=Aneurinibacillus uraniidurans TaxID=2966586 RepID=UPI002349E859|nr:M2 family metallopeptidase [Aneurinibacillus sp. B1]WCN37131.1 M2 family metallopeptidase [Aneurinibacillus sp. B1]